MVSEGGLGGGPLTFGSRYTIAGGFPGGSVVKESTCQTGTWVRSLGQEDPWEKGMTSHSSILAWEIHGQRSLARYIQSMGS